jgi:hypothetical protein
MSPSLLRSSRASVDVADPAAPGLDRLGPVWSSRRDRRGSKRSFESGASPRKETKSCLTILKGAPSFCRCLYQALLGGMHGGTA